MEYPSDTPTGEGIDACGSSWSHHHGVSTCRLPAGHDGKHEGRCWACWEDGEFDGLTWTDETPGVRP